MKKNLPITVCFLICTIFAALCGIFAGCGVDGEPDYEAVYNNTQIDADVHKSKSHGVTAYDGGERFVFSGVKFSGVLGYGFSLRSCTSMTFDFEVETGKAKAVLASYDKSHIYAVKEGNFEGLITDDIVFDRCYVCVIGVDSDFKLTVTLNGSSENPSPKPDEGSDFEKIKTAYKEAGYNVNLTSDDMDASMSALVANLQQLYEQLGYGICYIGKNLDNAANMELYMLISTDSESSARELANGLTGYRYEQKGKNVIVSVNLILSNPNFEPFKNVN